MTNEDPFIVVTGCVHEGRVYLSHQNKNSTIEYSGDLPDWGWTPLDDSGKSCATVRQSEFHFLYISSRTDHD